MRHIDLAQILTQIFADANGQKAKKALERAHKKLAKKRSPNTRKQYVDANGSRKWKPIKNGFTDQRGKKCWYTEVELIGAPLAIDHFRPVNHYWWLAFDAENYRLACPWANSPEHNALHGCGGGKGDNFPLLSANSLRALNKKQLTNEQPVILDPCSATDCALLAFETDGRPILNPASAADPIARQRVDESKILLNLDHPDFNSKREQLCTDIKDDVMAHEDLPVTSSQRAVIQNRIEKRLESKAPFSTAARFYLKHHRHLDWVEDILKRT